MGTAVLVRAGRGDGGQQSHATSSPRGRRRAPGTATLWLAELFHGSWTVLEGTSSALLVGALRATGGLQRHRHGVSRAVPKKDPSYLSPSSSHASATPNGEGVPTFQSTAFSPLLILSVEKGETEPNSLKCFLKNNAYLLQ